MHPKMGARLAFPDRRPAPRAAAARRARAPRSCSPAAATRASARSGMLRALLERGIVPDVVIGTSAGALNGAGGLLRAEPHRRRPARRGVGAAPQRPRVPRRARSTGPGTSCAAARTSSATRASKRSSTTARPARSFSDLEIPLRVIATDLDTGEEVVLARGPLKPALLASTALPGVFPIVHHDGRRLVDGGVVDNVPLWHALAGPVDRVFVLNVSSGTADRVRALAARRGDDELHARAQPALRARAALRAARRSR